jgi:hypothetical protein
VAWDSPLLDLMPDTVTVYAASTPRPDGSDGFSTSGTSYRARVTFDPATVARAAGPTDDVSAVAWIASTAVIARSAAITLPDGTSPPVKQVVRVDDGDGLHHVKVLFGA